MDNIIIKKKYDEDGLIELKVTVDSKFIKAYQYCYIQDIDLKMNAEKILYYSKHYDNACYIEFGEKDGDFTPAFSLEFLKADVRGHVKIEVDIEIADNGNRSHRCSCYVETELGLVEQFGNHIQKLILADINTEISLCR